MFNFNQPLQTVDGRNARFLGEILTKTGSRFVVAICQKNEECVYLYDKDGNTFHSGLKLIPRKPEPIEKTFTYVA